MVWACCHYTNSQVQNVNIGGSFSGSFLLSGGAEANYEIAGSPYLSETWMYGTLEMKSEIANQIAQEKKEKAKVREYQAKISKIDALIKKLSDPDFEAAGLALEMEGIDPDKKSGL